MKNRAWLAAALLLILGLMQMAADLLGLSALKGVAAATQASPAPKVFSAVQGLETYSTRFYLEWKTREGQFQSQQITPEIYSRIRGPYNRRNVYGAVLAYGPVLVSDSRTKPMFDAVARYALCDDAPLLEELGLTSADVRHLRVRLEPRPSANVGALPMTLEAPCS